MSSRLAALLNPQAIALVGCPADPERPGARPLVYLRKHGYPGRIYPVNRRHAEIAGLRAYPTLADLPERPDVAWIGVPLDEVAAVLDEVGRLKIANAVILTAGFGETGVTGRDREQTLKRIAEERGITVLGPNMLGFINCWERVPLTYSPAGGLERLIPGALGIASQSGALAGIVVNRAFDRLIGVSAMISTGNEAGITVSECLEYFAEDPRTRAVALVAEGIRDGERFKAAADRLLRADKALVALKVGRSTSGRRNALTHTGALAGSHEAWRAVARQLGIVEVETFEELVEVAGFLSREPRTPHRGVAVLSTSGGASIMMADQLETHGFTLPSLAPPTVETLKQLLPEYAVTRENPVDVTAGLSEDLLERVLVALCADPNVDAVVAVVTGARGVERAERIARVARAAVKPLVACWLSASITEAGVPVLDDHGVPCFRSARTVGLALAAARDVAAARRRRRASRPGSVRVRRVGVPDTYAELAALARHAGIPLPPQALAGTPAEAARAARRVGLPVALKVVADDLPHKSEAGALVLNLSSPAAVRRAAVRLLKRARGRRLEGLLVQRMVEGVEVLAGVTRDPTFGLLLVVGAGGVQAELIRDTTARPLPVTRADIGAMLGEVRSLGALRGFRGTPPADVPALLGALRGMSRMALALGERLQALDANPIVVAPRGGGAFAVDLLLHTEPESGRSVASAYKIEIDRGTPPPSGRTRSQGGELDDA